ncbi:MAG: hypothetical protein LBG50_02915 [Clostridiales Family XIII bacterium]|jgi:hypothetical protein|nr:hypothetical protein [Clostridiales Family XIII bacterium]
MASKKNQNGYSEALGGYGVPSQVEMTAKSAPAPRASFSPNFSFGMDKKKIIIIAAVAVVVVLAVLYFAGVFNQYGSRILEIQVTQQSQNGAMATNYMPVLKEDVKWAELSDGERAGIAKYAVNASQARAKKDEANIFNIMGLSYVRETIFLYDRDKNKIQILVDRQITANIDA